MSNATCGQTYVGDLEFFVPGDPAPQGSKRHVGNGRMIESSKALAPWRSEVTAAAIEAVRLTGWKTADQPVDVHLTFWLRRPPSAPKSRAWPDRRPDIDKLARAVLDALTVSGVIADDARVIWLSAGKQYTDAGTATGVHVCIAPSGASA